jgi:eukaryotic-like serine/threonine-protein kinase
MTIPAGARLGAYEVLAPLGAGGMGEVYRAKDTRLGREVALKVLPESVADDRDRLSRFEQEARSASALNHPNIVTIHEIGREGETAFIAMELVDGKTLRELTVSGPMPVRKILGIAAQIAEGLSKAHGAGIAHRDLKPENVMVSRDGFVKILDFGLAKLTDPESGEASAMPTLAQPETRPGTVLGTVGYMSPEQASGEPLDYRSDQFSLGSMLYEMATGQKAFGRKTAAETMSAIIREEPEPVSKLRPDFPVAVRWILDRCLAKDPEERYASTRDLARDLAGLRDHISEASSGAEALLSSPARRRSGFRWIAAALTLAAVAGAVGWLAARSFSSRGPSAPSFKRLSFQRGSIGNARFAPDGHTIVYGFQPSGIREMVLSLTRLDSAESRPFEFRGDILSISKSGELAIWQPQPQASALGTLAVVPMTVGAPRPLAENVVWSSGDWDPQGKELVIVRQEAGSNRLEFPIGKVLVPADVLSARFSPDGREIAFWKGDGGETKLAVIDRLGKREGILSSGWKNVAGVPCWSTDGREVWFTASKAMGTDALWAVSLSGKARQLVKVPGTLELYDVGPGGRALLGHHTIIRSLRGLVFGESDSRELAWLDSSLPADLSADGTTVLITEDGEGAGTGPAVYLRSTDGAPAVRIGDGEAVALSRDKQWVLIRREKDGRRHFVLVPAGAGQPRPLDFPGLDVGAGAFTPDGKQIVFGARGPGASQGIYIADVAGGKPRSVGPPGSAFQQFASPVSPDGRRAVAMRKGKFTVFSLDGSEPPRELPDLSPPVDRAIQWTADSRSLYVHSVIGRPLAVELCDVQTGKRKLWKQLPLENPNFQLRVRVTPDGRAYVYGSRAVFSELYLVEGLR